MSQTLTETATAYAAEIAAPGSRAEVAIKRAFMAGGLEVLSLLKAGATREQLMAEVIQFGRAVGSKAERATN